jgi:hypothetical protein
MTKIGDVVVDIIRSTAKNRKLRIGILLQGDERIAERIVADGHQIVLIGEKFPLLYRVYKRLSSPQVQKPLIVEANFTDLPIGKGTLDAIVLLRGLPKNGPPKQALLTFRSLLRQSGIFIWPQPITEGFGGKVGQMIAVSRTGTMGALPRVQLTSLVMGSGFKDVGQVLLTGKFIPWVVTTGLVGPRPWDNPNKNGIGSGINS